MVPFPHVFKAKLLSKSWSARLSPSGTQEDAEEKLVNEEKLEKEEKCLAASFQAQVCGWTTTRWPTFCPLFVRKDGFLGYDQTSQQWRKLPLLDFLPERIFTTANWWQLEGSLLLVSTKVSPTPDAGSFPLILDLGDLFLPGFTRYDFFVTNLLTRKWKQLPDRPDVPKRSHLGEKWLIRKSAQAYKVVVFDEVFKENRCLVEIFDSELRKWSGTSFRGPADDGMMSNWAYLNGVLYRLVGPVRRVVRGGYIPSGLLAFDVAELKFEVLELPDVDIPSAWLDLVVCDGDLMMVVYRDLHRCEDAADGVVVVRIDLVSRLWVKVTEGPPAALNFGTVIIRPASDGASVFFSGMTVESGILTYNVSEGQWSCLSLPQESGPESFELNRAPSSPHTLDSKYVWEPSSFEPGLNPFSAV